MANLTLKLSTVLILFTSFLNAFFFQQQQQQQQHNGQVDIDYQDKFLMNTQCQDYLCPTTLKCVKQAVDCPCLYPGTQMKCLIEEKGKVIDTVCISKPFIENNPSLQEKYDDIKQGYKLKTKGVRDCGWAIEAYYGKV